MSAPPNLLFIFTDQQTRCAMSASGNAALSTPNMDRIANEGVRFDRTYCASPVCGPARAALMTGRMPHEAGTNVNGEPFPESTRTMGHVFENAGYETAYIGKWHLPKPHLWDREHAAHGFRFLAKPQAAEAAEDARDHDQLTADAAIDFLREPHTQPFLLTVSLDNPHDICGAVSREGVEPRTEAQGPALPQNFPRDPDEPQFITECRQREHYGGEQAHTAGWSLDHWRGYLHRYHRLVERVDEQVGRILDALRDQHLEQNTLVVFTSDHGEGVAAHQWVVKLMLYEEPVTVPLAIRLPGIIPAGRVDTAHLVSSIDLLPTFCDYANVPIPDDLAGQSLRPLIEQPEKPGRDYVISELQPDTKDPSRLGRMVRTKRYKYVVFSHGRRAEMLFDLDNDPGERHNLARTPDAEPILQQHRELLSQWINETNDHFPVDVIPGIATART